MGYSWTNLIRDEFGRKEAKQNFAFVLIVMMLVGVLMLMLQAPVGADYWTDTTTENFAQGAHENTENVDSNVRLENIGVGETIYRIQGRFTSRFFDAGVVVQSWDNISWNLTTPSSTKLENDNVGAEPTQLIDGENRIGENLTSFTYTRDNDVVYENINEAGAGVGNPESGSPYLLIVQGAPEKGTSVWWGWVVINPTDSTITVTEVRVKDNIGKDWNWAINVQGYPTSGWADGGADGLYWFGSENILAHSATYFRVRVTQGGVNELADHTMIWTVTGTENLERSSVIVGIDKGSQGGMFYNKPGDTTEQTEAGTYPDGLYAYLDVDENDDPLSARTEYVFYVNVHEWLGKAIDPGGTLTITIPKEFTNVALVDYTDFTDATVSGSGTENWTIQGTNNSAIQNDVIHLSFKATTPSTYSTKSNWEFDTRFIGTGDKGETVRYICEAVVSIQASASAGYSLNWEHRVENVATGYDNYWVRVRGYTSGDSENISVYIWKSSTSSWEFLDNLDNTGIKTITKYIAGSSISDYLTSNNLSIKYEDHVDAGDNQTKIHIDYVVLEEQKFYETEIKFQVRTSADNITWIDNLGPDGTPNTYFMVSPTSLENIGDNRYFQYIAYFSTEDNTITPVLHDVTINYTTGSAPDWQLIETWTGTVSAPAHWNLIETWTGTVSAPVQWRLIETWTGTVSIPAAWQLTETWTGTVEAPALWYLTESWTGIVEASAAWQLIESWTGVVENVTMSSSRVDPISPYWRTFVPFTVTATASDVDGYVENVELWYRYSTDNSSWGTWTSFGLDNDNSDGWSWSFTAPSGDDYYELYSISRNNDGNVEPAPAEADARSGVDIVAPTITSIVIDDNAGLTSLTSVTLAIDASDATSGLVEMRFSDDNLSWSDWEDFAAGKSYTLPTGDGLKTIYVQVKDKAGLSSTVASDSITLETILPPPPVEPTPSVEPQPVTPLSVEPQPVTSQPITPPPVEPQPITPAPTPSVTTVVPPPIQPPPFLYAVLFMTASVVGFAAVYRMLARPSRYYVMLKQLERAMIRPRIRRIGKLLPKPPARAPRRVSRVELAALRRLERVARKRFDLS